MTSNDTKSIVVIILLAIGIVLCAANIFTGNKTFGTCGIIVASGATAYCWYELCKLVNKK